jgi:YHS domain-containing protein
MWLRTLLLFLLVIFALRFVMRLVRGVRSGMADPTAGGSNRSRAASRPPVKMVADPVCGTFVIPGKALQVARGRETHYFCSEACRDKWMAAP